MEEITIYKFQLETILEALRITSNIHESHKGETCHDRQVRQAYEYAKNALAGKKDEVVPYVGGKNLKVSLAEPSNEKLNSGQLQQHNVSGRVFEGFHCQKDYITDTVTVQFRGDFDKEKAIDYMLRCYPSFEGREVIELSPNDFYMGLENIGYAVFQ